MSEAEWVFETIHDDLGFRVGLRAERVLVRERTALQHLEVFENSLFGRVLMLDGAVQLTTADEFVYHEMMAHVPILAHGAARRVLVVGGGDGGVAREVLRHRTVEAVTLVEIDRAVIDFCREHFPDVSAGAFEDPRLSVVIADGIRFVAETAQRFDVVIVDSTDPVGPAAGLFTASFYAACRRCLAGGGVLVTQSGVPFVQGDELAAAAAALSEAFGSARFFLSTVPSYVGGSMAHGFASTGPSAVPEAEAVLEARFEAASLATRYYTPAVHAAAFALPAFVGETAASKRP